MQIASRAGQDEILQFGAPAFALWDDVLDVKSGSLEALVHQAVLAPPIGTRPNCARQFFRDAHYGCLPKNLQCLAADERQLLAQFNQCLQFFPFRFLQKPFVIAVH